MTTTVVSESRRSRVLIVEDDPGQLLTLSAILQEEGYEVDGYSTAKSLLDVILPGTAAVAVIDLRLPDMDGTILLQHLRQIDPALRVILHTAYGSFGSAKEAVNLGAFGYIEKLGDPTELLSQVQRAVLDRPAGQEAPAQLDTILRSVPLGVAFVDRYLRYRHVNPTQAIMHGLPPADLIGRTVLEVNTPLSRAIRPYFQSIIDGSGQCPEVEFDRSIVTGATEDRWFLARFYPVRSPFGTLLGAGTFFLDITHRKRAERDAFWRAAIVEASSDAIIGSGTDDRIQSWNPSAERLFGYSAQEAISQPVTRLINSAQVGQLQKYLKQVRAGDRIDSQPLLLRHRDGTAIDVSMGLSPVRDESDAIIGTAMVVHDLRSLKRLEEQFRQSQKMETMGRLAGGVAHDFNNLLTVITGYSDLLLDMWPADLPHREYLAEVLRTAQRAAGLTRQLLALSRKQVVEPKLVPLVQLVRDNLGMFRRIVGEDIELVMNLDDRCGGIEADPGQIEQLLLNLIVNSRDAMPNGGRVTVSTQCDVIREAVMTQDEEIAPGRYAVLSVKDEGCGIAPDVLPHIFDPFFTTKGQYGSGLGLAVVQGVVKQTNGRISVKSQLGQGTTFTIAWPQASTSANGSRIEMPLGQSPHGSETILIVEDELALRQLTCRVLTSYGYAVEETGNAMAAQEIASRREKPFDLLIVDVVMPVMNGRQVAEQLRARWPEMKVLYTSGYTDDSVLRHGVTASEVAFLQKPFTPRTLAKKVREVLDTPQSARHS